MGIFLCKDPDHPSLFGRGPPFLKNKKTIAIASFFERPINTRLSDGTLHSLLISFLQWNRKVGANIIPTYTR